MAKAKTIPDNSDLVSIKFPTELWRKLCVVAAHRGISKTKALEQYAGIGILREHRKVMDEGHRELGENGA